MLQRFTWEYASITLLVPRYSISDYQLTRHTKAMNLLQAGVSLIYIRDLLGHVDIATTEIYARADTEMKRKALEKAYPEMVPTNFPHWEKDDALLTWLANL